MNKSKKIIYFFIIVFALILINFIIAADTPSSGDGIPVSGGGTNPAEVSGNSPAGGTAPQTPVKGEITLADKPQDVSQYFGYDSGRVMASGTPGKKFNFERAADGITSIQPREASTDPIDKFGIHFYGTDKKTEERSYEFQGGLPKLGFDKKGQLRSVEGQESFSVETVKGGKTESFITTKKDEIGETRRVNGIEEKVFEPNKILFDENGQLAGGSKFRTGSGEKTVCDGSSCKRENIGNQVLINGYKHNIQAGAKVEAENALLPGPNGGSSFKVNILVDKEINRPEKSPGKSSNENAIVDYKTQGKDVKYKYKNSAGKEISIPFSGEMNFQGGDRGNVPFQEQGKNFNYGGVDFQDSSRLGLEQYKKTFVYPEESEKAITDIKNNGGAAVFLDPDKRIMKVAASQHGSSPILVPSEDNSFVKLADRSILKDNKPRAIALMADGTGASDYGVVSASIQENPKKEETLKISLAGTGAQLDMDDYHLEMQSDDLYYFKGSRLIKDAKDTLSYASKIVFTNENGEPVNQYGYDFMTDNFNRGAAVKQTEKFNLNNGFYITPKLGMAMTPNLRMNYLPPTIQDYVSRIDPKSKDYETLTNYNFWEMTPGKQEEFISKAKQKISPAPPTGPIQPGTPPIPPENPPSPSQPQKPILPSPPGTPPIPPENPSPSQPQKPILPSPPGTPEDKLKVLQNSPISNLLGYFNPSPDTKLYVARFSTRDCSACPGFASAVESSGIKKIPGVQVGTVEFQSFRVANQLATNYGVSAYPTTIVFNQNGAEVGRVVGGNIGQLQNIINRNLRG